MLETANLSFSYNAGREDALPTLHNIDLRIAPGELVAILGTNGSGKSTLAKLLCATLAPTEGSISVDGLVSAAGTLWEVRRQVGMVFQQPDDQLVANTVIDDIAFGPENLGLPREDINRRVQDVLAVLGLAGREQAQISELTGGEKQRVAIAGVLAMQPSYLILDEPTTMLPPHVARQLIALIHTLRSKLDTAFIYITHFMHEVVSFDRIIVLDGGRIVIDGLPRQVFSRANELRALGLAVPQVTELGQRLRTRGIALPEVILNAEELAAALTPLTMQDERRTTNDERRTTNDEQAVPLIADGQRTTDDGHPMLETRDLHHTYMAGTPLAREALRGIDCAVYAGETLALLGGTQAGKSTLIEFFNALRVAPAGHVFFEGRDTSEKSFDRVALRETVGIVFQQAESQLFEDTVGKDVSYVPRQKKLPPAESRAIVAKALTDVGLDYETFRLRYVYALSGGQKRRVALAGVLAAQPRVLILDEPVAGLDPRGRADLAALIIELTKRLGLTVILVGNTIDALAELADRAVVLHEGRVVMQGSPRTLLRRADELHSFGLELGEPAEIALTLRSVFADLPTDLLRLDELEEAIVAQLAAFGAGDQVTG